MAGSFHDSNALVMSKLPKSNIFGNIYKCLFFGLASLGLITSIGN